jgi:hypothetical protein
MGKLLQFKSKEQLLEEQFKTLLADQIDSGWTDNKIEKLLEDIQNMPSDEEELIATLHAVSEIETEIFDAMNVKNYEKFFYLKVGIESMLENIKSGAYKQDF